MPHDTVEIASLLFEIGQRLALAGDNPYRARSYARAAQSLLSLVAPVEEVIREGRLTDLPGVGPSLAGVIRELHEHGTTPTLSKLRAAYPPGVLELLHVPGLPPEKVRLLHDRAGIASLDELESAARAGRLQVLKGFGPSFEAKILSSVAELRRTRGRKLIHHAGEDLRRLEDGLTAAHPELRRLAPAGEFRRGLELVQAAVLVAESAEGSAIEILELAGRAQLWLAPPGLYGPALVLATGSDDHLAALRAHACAMNLYLDTEGLRRGRALLPCPEEADVYRALKLPFIDPELRETGEEVALAAKGRLPKLVALGDLRGLIHCHTDFSDGADTLEAMAEATRARGYAYFGVADHSRSASYAGGLAVESVLEQRRAVRELNARYGSAFRILHGIESDILPDGSLDYPDEILGQLDYVVASVHSRFRLSEEEQTERVIRAVRNPFTTVLGHMTGRLLKSRQGYDVDVPRVLAACAEAGVAVEINANPHRLDLDWRWHRTALELGCLFSINPDAHSAEELDLTAWGVSMARKGGIGPDRVLNARPFEDWPKRVG
ncbi:DNA polymerase/3'-5' exonuclease PolX [Alsobacter soli]|uniref:DNA polymerase/3'-5' exonuclease PolX n=1 Tax=Alsobacter soli TaxID=2109933 RepID=A0A2T1HNS5_9HYPH|nr:DNA polymerase/3'-5' exonuclease PolX [Alsobacter soli]PSC03286.1 DNA polymerase/3'-5' exonuclease PolX [Alsobacter soli]